MEQLLSGFLTSSERKFLFAEHSRFASHEDTSFAGDGPLAPWLVRRLIYCDFLLFYHAVFSLLTHIPLDILR